MLPKWLTFKKQINSQSKECPFKGITLSFKKLLKIPTIKPYKEIVKIDG
jgi:hypothetical protein